MDTAILSVVIANVVSILTLAVSIIIEVVENKKSRWVKTITVNGTLVHNEMVRDCNSTILALTNPLRLRPGMTLSHEDESALFKCISKLETHLTIAVESEADILIAIRNLINNFMQYVATPNDELREEVIKWREKYFFLISVYDFADWKYIKSQIRGKGTLHNFESCYQDILAMYSVADKNVDLPEWGKIENNKKIK